MAITGNRLSLNIPFPTLAQNALNTDAAVQKTPLFTVHNLHLDSHVSGSADRVLRTWNASGMESSTKLFLRSGQGFHTKLLERIPN